MLNLSVSAWAVDTAAAAGAAATNAALAETTKNAEKKKDEAQGNLEKAEQGLKDAQASGDSGKMIEASSKIDIAKQDLEEKTERYNALKNNLDQANKGLQTVKDRIAAGDKSNPTPNASNAKSTNPLDPIRDTDNIVQGAQAPATAQAALDGVKQIGQALSDNLSAGLSQTLGGLGDVASSVGKTAASGLDTAVASAATSSAATANAKQMQATSQVPSQLTQDGITYPYVGTTPDGKTHLYGNNGTNYGATFEGNKLMFQGPGSGQTTYDPGSTVNYKTGQASSGGAAQNGLSYGTSPDSVQSAQAISKFANQLADTSLIPAVKTAGSALQTGISQALQGPPPPGPGTIPWSPAASGPEMPTYTAPASGGLPSNLMNPDSFWPPTKTSAPSIAPPRPAPVAPAPPPPTNWKQSGLGFRASGSRGRLLQSLQP